MLFKDSAFISPQRREIDDFYVLFNQIFQLLVKISGLFSYLFEDFIGML